MEYLYAMVSPVGVCYLFSNKVLFKAETLAYHSNIYNYTCDYHFQIVLIDI